jgi:hypothetical protein
MVVPHQEWETHHLPDPSEPVAIPRHTWELSQLEIHNLRQLVGVVLINCQLAQRGTLTEAEAVRRSVSAIATQQASQHEAFRILFGSTPACPTRPSTSATATSG